MRKLLGHTHYRPTHGGMSHLFTLGKCENCGGDVQEPNSILVETKACRAFGLIQLPGQLPAETSYSNELECEVCENCG